ncbi:hypothetical protein LEMLEM_LOCUS1331 [Lemmus lemmus]
MDEVSGQSSCEHWFPNGFHPLDNDLLCNEEFLRLLFTAQLQLRGHERLRCLQGEAVYPAVRVTEFESQGLGFWYRLDEQSLTMQPRLT